MAEGLPDDRKQTFRHLAAGRQHLTAQKGNMILYDERK